MSYVGYSYWRNTNNHVGSPTMFIFLGTDGNRGGQGPTLIAYNKQTDEVQNRGSLFPANSPYSYATGEGWYFSGTQPTKLYTFLVGGTQLRRYDVVARQFEAVPAVDLAACRRRGICPSNAAYIFQPHSSDDDLVHSATVQNAAQRLRADPERQSRCDRPVLHLDHQHGGRSPGCLPREDSRHTGAGGITSTDNAPPLTAAFRALRVFVVKRVVLFTTRLAHGQKPRSHEANKQGIGASSW